MSSSFRILLHLVTTSQLCCNIYIYILLSSKASWTFFTSALIKSLLKRSWIDSVSYNAWRNELESVKKHSLRSFTFPSAKKTYIHRKLNLRSFCNVSFCKIAFLSNQIASISTNLCLRTRGGAGGREEVTWKWNHFLILIAGPHFSFSGRSVDSGGTSLYPESNFKECDSKRWNKSRKFQRPRWREEHAHVHCTLLRA